MQAPAGAGIAKVELRDVGLRYFGAEGETEALKGVSLAVAPGEFVAIIGQSGCGKSTLLSLISGILQPTEGAVLVDGMPVSGPNRKVGYMLQQDYLFEWLRRERRGHLTVRTTPERCLPQGAHQTFRGDDASYVSLVGI